MAHLHIIIDDKLKEDLKIKAIQSHKKIKFIVADLIKDWLKGKHDKNLGFDSKK